jgi:hypothetical protein
MTHSYRFTLSPVGTVPPNCVTRRTAWNRVALIGALAVLGAACQDGSGVTGTGSTSRPDTSIAAVLTSRGFSVAGMLDRGDAVVVEGDIQISKALVSKWAAEALPSPWRHRPNFQWSTNTLVGQSQAQTIVVSVSGLSSLPDWQTAARNAMWYWNAVSNSVVYMVEGSSADITFAAADMGSNTGTAAVATFPADASGGKPGPTITINTTYSGSPNTASTKLNNMVHELGHTLGFRHTNWQSVPCFGGASEGTGTYGANQVSGTPSTDAGSVMNACTATNSWAGFSSYDLVAIRTLYPGPSDLSASVSGPTTISTGTGTWTAGASGGQTPYTFAWSRRNFCDADFQPISVGQSYSEEMVYGQDPFYLKVTASTGFKNQTAIAIQHVGGFITC